MKSSNELKSWLARTLMEVLLVLAAFGVWASPVTTDDARTAVGNWLSCRPQLGCRLGTAVTAARTCTTTNGAAFHVVKLEGGGFVVTSADTEHEPVVAFSASDDLVESEKNPLWQILCLDFSAQVGRARLTQAATASSTGVAVDTPAAKWAKLLPAKSTNGVARLMLASAGRETLSDVRVAPLVETKWSQQQDSLYSNKGNPCYNYYTPENYPCGCVATAGAQIMRYHKYPTASVTPGTYACRIQTGKDYYPVYEDHSLTMAGGFYDWEKMPLVPANGTTLAQRMAIGKLTSDVGIACLMAYGENGSSAGGYMLARCLPERFGYANAMAICDAGQVMANQVRRAICSNLNAKLPVLVGVNAGTSGHAVVADGYGYSMSTFYVHFNLGSAGTDDAWYAPPNVAEYNSIKTLVCNIYPEGVENGVICSGRITDGEGNPLPDAEVSAKGASTQTTQTDANGIYAFILAPGAYTLSAGNASQSVTLSANVGTQVNDDGTYSVRPYAVNNLCDVDLTMSDDAQPDVSAGVWTTDVDGVKKASDCNLVVVLCANYGGCWWSQQAQAVFEDAAFLSWAAENGVYLVTSDSSHLPAGCADVKDAQSWFWTLYGSVLHPDGYVYFPSIAVTSPADFDQAVGYAVVRNDDAQKIGDVKYDGTVDALINGLATYLREASEIVNYTVTFDLGEHGTRTGGGALVQSVRAGETAVAPTVAASEGWSFVGWDKAFDSVTANLTVEAQYQQSEPADPLPGADPTFSARITGVALVADHEDYDPNGVSFVDPATPLTVPCGTSVIFRVSYDYPDDYAATVWIQDRYAEGETSYGQYFGSNPSAYYSGQGEAYGFLVLREDVECPTVNLKRVAVRAGFSPVPEGFASEMDLSQTSVNLTFEGSPAETEPTHQYVVDDLETIDASTFSATTYDGYLYDETSGSVKGTIQVKAAKAKYNRKTELTTTKLTISIQPYGETKKVSISGNYDLDVGDEQTFTARNGRSVTLTLGANGLTGSFEGALIEGVANVFLLKDAESKLAASEAESAYVGTYNAFAGEGVFTISVAKKGKVKLSGTLASGTKVSASAQLLVGEDVACAPFVLTKHGLAFVLWFDRSKGVVATCVAGLTDAVVGAAGSLSGDKAFYVDIAALSNALTTVSIRPLTVFMPYAVPVEQNGQKWRVADGAKAGRIKYDAGADYVYDALDSANPAGLTLSYAVKTGAFTGSFKAYGVVNGKLKTYTAKVSGVLVNGEGCGYATIAKVGNAPIRIVDSNEGP